ncbi:MAG: TlpA disulfide reductase family protein [Halioglobus sp.]
MRSWLAGALLLMLTTGCGQPPSSAAETSRTLEALRGQWVVINYWAKWCKPCIKEIPELNELDSSYASVTVLGVNYDGATGAELTEQTQRFGVEFVSLGEDPAALLQIPRPVVLPTTIILNPAGAVVQTLVGPQTLESLTLATVDSVQDE